MNPNEPDRPTDADSASKSDAPAAAAGPRPKRRWRRRLVLAAACFGLAMLYAPLRQLIFGPKVGGYPLATWQNYYRGWIDNDFEMARAARRTPSPVEVFLRTHFYAMYARAQPTGAEWVSLSPADQRVVLLSLADDPDEFVRAHVAGSLGYVPADPEVVARLRGCLRENSSLVRGRAVGAFGQLKPPSAESVPDLVKLLDDPDPEMGVSVAWTLRIIGASRPEWVLPVVISRLRSPDAAKRRQALYMMGQLGAAGRAVTPTALEALRDPDPHVRADAADALGVLAVPETAPVLIAALRDPDRDVRDSAARAVGVIGADAGAAIPILLEQVQALPENEPIVRRGVPQLQAIGRMGYAARPYLPELEKLRQHKSKAVRLAVPWALWSIDPTRFPFPEVGPDGQRPKPI